MFYSPHDVLVVYSTSHQRTPMPGPEERPFGRVDCNCLFVQGNRPYGFSLGKWEQPGNKVV